MTRTITPETLILLPGGFSILIFSGLDIVLPDQAMVEIGTQACSWMNIGWNDDTQGHAISMLGAVPSTGFDVMCASGQHVHVGTARNLTPDIKKLAQIVRELKGPLPDIFQLLHATVEDLASSEMTEILVRFLDLAAEHSGFVEVVAIPETGGLFLQGWSNQEMGEKYTLLTGIGEVSATCAGFTREDLIAPASGFCLYARNHPEALKNAKSVYVWRQNDLRRLDVLPDIATPFTGVEASEHIRAMVPSLIAKDPVLAQFKRMCRPLFTGDDTLSKFEGPVAVGLDMVLRAEEGLFVTGWMLDPLAQVDLTLVKSTANLYSNLWSKAHSLQRPDLLDAFGQDPRFAGLLDPKETRNGFLCFIPATAAELDGADVYLELVLHNGQCLFQPIAPRLCRDLGAAHAVLNTVPRHDPALGTILTKHVAPFIAGLSPKASDGRYQMIPMGDDIVARNCTVTALMTMSSPDDLKAVFASLSNTPEAQDLELIVIIDDTLDPKIVSNLQDQFSFFGLHGGALACAKHMSQAARLDVATKATNTPHILLWCPQALPQTAGWLDVLRAEASKLATPGLVSPLLCYEDGSIHFGGGRIEGRPAEAISQLAGFNRHAKIGIQKTEVSAGSPELALIDREVLHAVGGIAGCLLGDKYTHHGLGARLRERDAAAWCTPLVEFWMLSDRSAASNTADSAFIDSVDSALLAHLDTSQKAISSI